MRSLTRLSTISSSMSATNAGNDLHWPGHPWPTGEASVTDEDQVRAMIALWSQADADKDVKAFAALFTEDGTYRGRRVPRPRGPAQEPRRPDRRQPARPGDHAPVLRGAD